MEKSDQLDREETRRKVILRSIEFFRCNKSREKRVCLVEKLEREELSVKDKMRRQFGKRGGDSGDQ